MAETQALYWFSMQILLVQRLPTNWMYKSNDVTNPLIVMSMDIGLCNLLFPLCWDLVHATRWNWFPFRRGILCSLGLYSTDEDSGEKLDGKLDKKMTHYKSAFGWTIMVRDAAHLPFTSSVVRFGWIVNTYRMGRTLFGRFGRNHGNASPFVAIGLNGNELL